MAYFGKYIRQILSRQEPVVFPGFGSLLMVRGKGINSEEGTIEPPGMIVKFDPNHPKSDGKLAQEYADGEDIDLEEARQQLLELVDAIKFKLDKGENYNLSLVGSFSRDDDNRIVFQKDPNWVVDPEIFGLNTIDLLELDSEEELKKEEEQKAVYEKTPDKEKLTKKATRPKDVDTEVSPPPQRRPVNKWRIIWIVIGSLFLVLVLLLLLPAGEGENEIEFSRDGIVLKNTQDPLSPPEQDGPALNEGDSPQPDAQSVNRPSGEAIQAEGKEAKYFIIAGSFQRLQNAEQLMQELKDKGFPAEVVYTDNRLYRVSIKSYTEKDIALSELEAVKARSGMSSAWVWTRN